jgi:hypothetical protein
MPVSQMVRKHIGTLLRPDESVHYVFPAESVLGMTPYVLVVASDQSIVVVSAGFRQISRPAAILARYQRTCSIGPVELTVPPTFTLGGVCYEVEDEYVAVINAADAERFPLESFLVDPFSEIP